MKRYWFVRRQKIFGGFGFTPCSWEGWLLTVLVVAGVVLDAQLIRVWIRDPQKAQLATLLIAVGLVGAYMWIASVKSADDPAPPREGRF